MASSLSYNNLKNEDNNNNNNNNNNNKQTTRRSTANSISTLDENELLFTEKELAKANGACYSRFWKQCPTKCLPLCLPCNCLLHPCRKAVSKDKNRYEEGTYSLDLVYLFPRLIICGFPAAGMEHIWRNPRLEVKRFLEEKHPGNYFMFNFCVEPGRCYPHEIFNNRVQRFPYKDHNVPHTKVLSRFLFTAKKWLDKDEKHVVVLHCKAGKGRAGMMSCALMLHMGWKGNPKEVLKYYDDKRVWRNKALTVPSQIRYVHYAQMVSEKVQEGLILEDLNGTLDSITIGPKDTVSPMNIKIHSQNDCIGNTKLLYHTKDNKNLHNNLNVKTKGNIKITLFLPNGKKCGRFWLNMAFEPGTTVTFYKKDIDKMSKDCKNDKRFPKDLFVRIDFKNIGNAIEMGQVNPLIQSQINNINNKNNNKEVVNSNVNGSANASSSSPPTTTTTTSNNVEKEANDINNKKINAAEEGVVEVNVRLERLSAPQTLTHTTLTRPMITKTIITTNNNKKLQQSKPETPIALKQMK